MKRKSIIRATALVMSIFALFTTVTYADGPEGAAEEAAAPSQELSEKLLGTAETQPDIYSGAAYVVEANTKQVVFSYNADVRHYPASVTKTMTALLAIENGNLDDVITASASAVNHSSLIIGGSSAGVLAGEQMTLRQFLYCLLLPSANEAACVIAEYVSGSVSAFVELMNTRAEQLGCTNTHFMNPHGLHNENHYSTAHDLYLIAAEFTKHPELMEIANTPSMVMPATNKSKERTLISTNDLISTKRKSNYFYENAQGIKTGYTTPAKHTLVTTAQKDGLYFIAALMYAPVVENKTVTSFVDAKTLFEWGFKSFAMQKLVKSGEAVSEAHITLCADKDSMVLTTNGEISILLPKGSYDAKKLELRPPEKVVELAAPVKKNTTVAKAEVLYDGVSYGYVDLVTSSSAELSNFMTITEDAGGFFSSPVFIILLVAIGVIVVGYIVFATLTAKKRSKSRRRSPTKRYK